MVNLTTISHFSRPSFYHFVRFLHYDPITPHNDSYMTHNEPNNRYYNRYDPISWSKPPIYDPKGAKIGHYDPLPLIVSPLQQRF